MTIEWKPRTDGERGTYAYTKDLLLIVDQEEGSEFYWRILVKAFRGDKISPMTMDMKALRPERTIKASQAEAERTAPLLLEMIWKWEEE